MSLKMRKTTVPPPPGGCPIGACLNLISGTWAPNIIWFLSGNPRRFSELKADIRGISSKMLTTRLKELQESGVVTRSVQPTSPPSVEYALTDLGHELVPAIAAIVEVGRKLRARHHPEAEAAE